MALKVFQYDRRLIENMDTIGTLEATGKFREVPGKWNFALECGRCRQYYVVIDAPKGCFQDSWRVVCPACGTHLELVPVSTDVYDWDEFLGCVVKGPQKIEVKVVTSDDTPSAAE
jgi:hypothetical protein